MDVLDLESVHYHLLNGRNAFFAPHLVTQPIHHPPLVIVVHSEPVLVEPLLKCLAFGVLFPTQCN